ncbi:STAS domain-containing protein [Kitasatospora terrestris]
MTDHTRSATGAGPVGVETVRAQGELDWEDAQEFAQRLTTALARSPRLLVVDLAQVTFADSSVLQALLTAHRRTAEDGGRLVLAGPLPEAVRRLLDLASATGYFHIAADAAAAADSGAGPAATRPPQAPPV